MVKVNSYQKVLHIPARHWKTLEKYRKLIQKIIIIIINFIKSDNEVKQRRSRKYLQGIVIATVREFATRSGERDILCQSSPLQRSSRIEHPLLRKVTFVTCFDVHINFLQFTYCYYIFQYLQSYKCITFFIIKFHLYYCNYLYFSFPTNIYPQLLGNLFF